MKDFLIKKTTGEKEPFQEEKIIASLKAVGANDHIIETILQTIQKEYPTIKNTKQIFFLAKALLKKANPALASRYNLKHALFALGPAGYPFEQYISALFQAEGYQTKTNLQLQGACVGHEVDILIEKNGHHHMVECKFHNRPRYKSDVKVSLYVQARLLDLQKNAVHHLNGAWIVTNTMFTQDAIAYASCEHIQLMSWSYPAGASLKDIITKHSLHPITALVNLTGSQKKLFLKHGWVLCKDAAKNEQMLKHLGLSKKEIAQIINDAENVCLR